MWSRVFRPVSVTPCILMRMASSTGSGKLAGKVAVVTASTEGIGFAIARRLGQDGAKVMVSSRKQANVDAAVKQLQSENLSVAGITCHVGKAQDRAKLIQETVKTFGGIDILVSNAAVNPVFGPIMDTSPESWDKIFDINVKATFFLCKETLPYIKERGKGSIVLISSVAGYVPFNLLGPYSVSKTSLLGLSKAMAPELAADNIRINVVCPGLIKTKFSQALWKSDAALEKTLEGIPLRRIGDPEDCSGIVSFLASDDSSYVTGESVLVTGGMTARL
ncbi:dehydrogenase/reductase SDR family member 4-like isoform X1 [Haliotis rubra]|uniref:dehydrogenase/reductase SDR family member 4-like isoform X1 n=1 Tax=Haliotis rubra TaxID=36100 RepID=UPI001EE57DE7|nr:dehydrogenase/reductase SDR family member 4-like isoform X1 [Haliotis rubra]XP_046544111.1 dehydrogenase/reductase SDR family member 4-like isoform X1 [Haliotis rubra]XP_046544112.1 dehydrogenase/reductase SDR family member 4-like isoform X1 [Haliotis rubra]XP_046544113.1 dehydrogenase/reductase SDR family member 4-like isoform X1 [Haliotis rubra]